MRTNPYITKQKIKNVKEPNPFIATIMRYLALVVAFASVFAFFIKILFF